MTRLPLLLALSSGATVTAVVWAVLRPPKRLRSRVRPYAHVARTRLLRAADPETYLAATAAPATIGQVFEPILERLSRLAARLLGQRDEAQLAVLLRQSGLYPGMNADERVAAYRRRTALTGLGIAAALGLTGWHSQGAAGLLAFGAAGFFLGSLMARGRVDNAVKARRQRMQSELYTVNQILAMRARAGGGVTDALRHVAARGAGAVVAEIRDILALSRTGVPITEALRRAATTTAEPEAGRLYHSLAIAQERGVDLADALLALAKDLRTARRDEAVTKAARQRLMAVVPIVVILAPIAIAFMAAPLPSLIFGGGTP